MSAAPVMPPLAEEKSIVAIGLEDFGKTQYVCSFHYMPIKVTRDFRTKVQGGYTTNYNLESVTDSRSRPFVLPVLDAFQRVFQGSDRSPKWAPVPLLARDIAQDIVRVATGTDDSNPNMLAPAVWISACRVPRTDAEWVGWGTPQFTENFPEFAQECKLYLRRQWRFSEEKVKEGDTFNTKKMPLEINNVHRMAAQYIGASRSAHEWIDQTSLDTTMACPFCGAKASSEHPKCGNCHETINPGLLKQVREQLTKV